MITKSNINPDVSIRFKLKDKIALQLSILEDAVHDAKTKALILANASGVKLGSIQSIQYDWAELEFYSRANFLNSQQLMRTEVPAMNLQPEEIENSDTVSIIWELENV